MKIIATMTVYEKWFIRQQRMAHDITYTHTHIYIPVLTLKNLVFCSHSIIMGIVLFTQWAMIISLTAATGVSIMDIRCMLYKVRTIFLNIWMNFGISRIVCGTSDAMKYLCHLVILSAQYVMHKHEKRILKLYVPYQLLSKTNRK
jgi:hypothetical protein